MTGKQRAILYSLLFIGLLLSACDGNKPLEDSDVAVVSETSTTGESTGSSDADSELTGKQTLIIANTGGCSKIAFTMIENSNHEIFTVCPDGSQLSKLTDDPAEDIQPAWSPDGKQLMWESYRDDNMEIYVANLDGSGLRNVSRDSTADDHGAAWSPWGRRIVFFSNRDDGWDLYALDLETGERTNLTMSEAQEQWPSWGP